MADLITPQFVVLDLEAPDRNAATRRLAETLAQGGRVTNLDGFLADVTAREAQMPTGIEGGIGIPHARSAYVTEPTLGFGRSSQGVDYGASDGPARLIFLIAAPDGAGGEHMNILAQLARKLINQQFKDSLLNAADAQAVVDIVNREVLGR